VAHPDERDDAVEMRPAPAPPAPERQVRLVAKQPRASRFLFLGKVNGASLVGEWVETAKNARADLQRKALEMGADVVKIDRVRVPPDAYRGSYVLLRGRAYREKKLTRPRPSSDDR
jgi:hypothetical protein